MPLHRAPSGGQLPFVQTIREGVAAAVPAANTAYLHLFKVSAPTPIAAMAFFVGAASGNVDVGIYVWDGTTFTRLTSNGGTLAAGSNANQKLTFASVVLVPGLTYALAFAADNGTVTIGRVALAAAVAAVGSQVVTKGTSYPLPATITAPAGTDREIYLAGTAS